MNNTTEKSVMTSPLADVRQAPLDQLSAPEAPDRLRPDSKGKLAVATFNSSL